MLRIWTLQSGNPEQRRNTPPDAHLTSGFGWLLQLEDECQRRQGISLQTTDPSFVWGMAKSLVKENKVNKNLSEVLYGKIFVLMNRWGRTQLKTSVMSISCYEFVKKKKKEVQHFLCETLCSCCTQTYNLPVCLLFLKQSVWSYNSYILLSSVYDAAFTECFLDL